MVGQIETMEMVLGIAVLGIGERYVVEYPDGTFAYYDDLESARDAIHDYVSEAYNALFGGE